MKHVWLVFVFALSFFQVSDLFAADKEELPKSGMLSTTRIGGESGMSIDGIWGGNDPSGNASAPISGSVSRVSPKEWMMRVFNNSEDTYRVGLQVVQFDDRGNRLKSDNFSYTLKGGESAERRVTSRPKTEQADLVVSNWTNISEKKREKEAATPAEEKSAG